MSILAKAKAKAFNGNVKEAFRNEAGAIDLASIMVGIIVIGLIGGVIAATVFAVIPWAQDNAAKGQLESVAQAQNAYTGLSTGDGTQATSYGTKAQLDTAGLINADALTDANVFIEVTAGTAGDIGSFASTVESASGKIWKITSDAPKAAIATAAVTDTV